MNADETITSIIRSLLARLGISAESVTVLPETPRRVFLIQSPDSRLLIGSRGAHLGAFSHLVKRIAAEELGEEAPLDFYIDVNDYRKSLIEEIKTTAMILAERARAFKTSVEMEPMPPAERMAVHLIFENTSDIKTESRGVGPKRRVVLTYVEPSSL